MQKKTPSLRDRRRRIFRRTRTLVLVVVVVLVGIRLCLPFAVESNVNRQSNQSREYGGRIGHVDLQLWRGQYRIHAIEIVKRANGGQTPFFAATRVNFSLEWREL